MKKDKPKTPDIHKHLDTDQLEAIAAFALDDSNKDVAEGGCRYVDGVPKLQSRLDKEVKNHLGNDVKDDEVLYCLGWLRAKRASFFDKNGNFNHGDFKIAVQKSVDEEGPAG
jgi:hypothetical protein